MMDAPDPPKYVRHDRGFLGNAAYEIHMTLENPAHSRLAMALSNLILLTILGRCGYEGRGLNGG